MTVENFTSGWTETDSGTILSQTSTVSTFAGMQAGVAYNQLMADKGAGAFPGDFKFRFAARVSAASSENSHAYLLGVNAAVPSEADPGNPWFALRWQASTPNPTLELAIFAAANETDTPDASDSYSGSAVGVGTYFYVEVERSGTTLTAKIYSNSGFSTLVDTLTLSGITVETYRYVTAPKTWWVGSGATISGTIENLDLAYSAGGGGVTDPGQFAPPSTGLSFGGGPGSFGW